jgi:hypothetical protein
MLPFSAFAAAEELIQLPEKVFTPDGFDNNDHAEFVLHGHFPNNCYRAGQATATIKNGKVFVTNIAYRDTDSLCTKMSVPWSTAVSIGALPKGSYPIYVLAPTGEQILFESLQVAEARSKSIDDYPYAYVNGVLVKVDRLRGIPLVTISGSFGMTCMYIRKIKIVQNKRDVISILPIVDFDRSKPCGYPFAPIPFERTIRFTNPLEARATLFHVRSMNGQALNRVVEY